MDILWQNSNSVDTIENNIRKSLMRIMKDKIQTKEPVSTKILNIINHTFDKLLILLSMDPLFFTAQVEERSTFSEQDVTEFYKQEIIIESERDQIQTQVIQVNTQTKFNSNQKNASSQLKSQGQLYNTRQRQKSLKTIPSQ